MQGRLFNIHSIYFVDRVYIELNTGSSSLRECPVPTSLRRLILSKDHRKVVVEQVSSF